MSGFVLFSLMLYSLRLNMQQLVSEHCIQGTEANP
jgi:hypothetical protein